MGNTKTSISGLQLQAQLIGTLIGIARAVDGNEHLISDSTDKIVREGLAATRPDASLGTGPLSALIQRAEDEKRKLIPHCYECAAPCGKNNNYDMCKLYAASEDTRSLKLLILYGIRNMAAYAYRAAALGRTDHEVNRFFYSAMATPAVTALDRNSNVLAEKACDTLLQILDGQKGISMETVVPVSLVERDSTR